MINILFSSRIIHDQRGDDVYDGWGSEVEFQVCAASSSEIEPDYQNSEEVESYPINLKKNDIAYVLGIRYGSGDSFGHCNGKGEIIWVYTTRELAEKAHSEYLEAVQNGYNKVNLTVEKTEEGVFNRQVGNICDGHFEKFEDLFIEEIVLNG